MSKKNIVISNKSGKPDNIVKRENELYESCTNIEKALPPYLRDYFTYLKNSVSISSRLAYLQDLRFFFRYMIKETDLTVAKKISDISLEEINSIKANDINYYLGEYCARYKLDGEKSTMIIENHNPSLSRKRSSLSVFFKFLFRNEMVAVNVVDGLNPIKMPKKSPDSIKRLQIEEVEIMLSNVKEGKGLTDKERSYWEKTKYRDMAILVLFLTYGLRLSELQGLNLSSFNFMRDEFIIYRKRGKESAMPLNNTVKKSLNEYIELERNKISAEKGSTEDQDALFLSLQGKRMNVKSIRELVKKYTSQPLGTLKSDGYSPHKLRATAASTLIEYGFSIFDVQNLLDHDNVTTTQLYSAHRKNAKRDLIKNYELSSEDNDD